MKKSTKGVVGLLIWLWGFSYLLSVVSKDSWVTFPMVMTAVYGFAYFMYVFVTGLSNDE